MLRLSLTIFSLIFLPSLPAVAESTSISGASLHSDSESEFFILTPDSGTNCIRISNGQSSNPPIDYRSDVVPCRKGYFGRPDALGNVELKSDTPGFITNSDLTNSLLNENYLVVADSRWSYQTGFIGNMIDVATYETIASVSSLNPSTYGYAEAWARAKDPVIITPISGSQDFSFTSQLSSLSLDVTLPGSIAGAYGDYHLNLIPDDNRPITVTNASTSNTDSNQLFEFDIVLRHDLDGNITHNVDIISNDGVFDKESFMKQLNFTDTTLNLTSPFEIFNNEMSPFQINEGESYKLSGQLISYASTPVPGPGLGLGGACAFYYSRRLRARLRVCGNTA